MIATLARWLAPVQRWLSWPLDRSDATTEPRRRREYGFFYAHPLIWMPPECGPWFDLEPPAAPLKHEDLEDDDEADEPRIMPRWEGYCTSRREEELSL